jgi:hypothetical protein
VIVQVGAYDFGLDLGPNGFGHQYDTLIVRVERVVDGKVCDPWIRVDYWGSNQHHQEDRLPDALFEPGHRWEMRLSPMRVSDGNYQFCGPVPAPTITDTDEAGKVIGEHNRYRNLSTEMVDLPETANLKCYALKRKDLREVRDSD